MQAEAQDEVHRLWDELSDFEANSSTEAAAHLMSFLAERTGAASATWAGAIRVDGNGPDDPLQGWRVAVVQPVPDKGARPNEDRVKGILREWDRRAIDPSFLLPLHAVGQFRTYSFRRHLPAAWFDSDFYRSHYGSAGIEDAAFIAFPLNADCESHFGFYSAAAFEDDQIALLAYALRGIKWFHRHLLLGSGLLMASTPLTGMERRVLQLLLTKSTEKDIARKSDIAVSTAHQHVTSIFRKFGVTSRAELMSLWLSPRS